MAFITTLNRVTRLELSHCSMSSDALSDLATTVKVGARHCHDAAQLTTHCRTGQRCKRVCLVPSTGAASPELEAQVLGGRA